MGGWTVHAVRAGGKNHPRFAHRCVCRAVPFGGSLRGSATPWSSDLFRWVFASRILYLL